MKGETQVYAVRHWMLKAGFYFVIGFVIVNLLLFVMHPDVSMATSNLVYALFYCVGLGLEWLLIKPHFFVIGREGLIYFAGTYVIYTPWENISGFDRISVEAGFGLSLKNVPQPMAIEQGIREGQVAIISGIRPNRGIKITSRYDGRNHIPLSRSLIFWRQTSLVKAIQHYLPQVEIDFTYRSLVRQAQPGSRVRK